MKHLDLFSGIGGAAYALDQVFENVEHTFCEIDPYCQKVLHKHWPQSQIYGDIRTLTAHSDKLGRIHGQSEIQPAKESHQTFSQPFPSDEPPFILTGGFPCQPFSQAGRRKGTADNRHLWPEMLRVIREFRPRWVVGENVAGLLTIEQGMVFEQVCVDLEKEGYEVQPFVIPAVAVNAPHRRDRVWIVAHAKSIGSERRPQEIREKNGRQNGELHTKPDGSNSNDPHAASIGRNNGFNNRQERHLPKDKGTSEKGESERQGWKRGVGKIGADASNGHSEGWTGIGDKGTGQSGLPHRKRSDEGRTWNANWLEVATELCGVDDGLPAELDGFKLSKSQHRTARLKGLGNAWVPQVAIEIFKAIKATELCEK